MPHVVVKAHAKEVEESSKVCPVKCFYVSPKGEYVINPDECIDCSACESFAQEGAILTDDTASQEDIDFNAEKSKEWEQCL